MTPSRREFLVASGAAALGAGLPRRILIRTTRGASFTRRLAERELLRGLALLAPSTDAQFTEGTAGAGDLLFRLNVQRQADANPESYSIAADAGGVTLAGATEQALLYAVFDFLERQGMFFGIDGPSLPLDPPRSLALPERGRPWTAQPRFAVRGLVPWPDFLNCISVYNDEDFRAYFEAMLRMRFNLFGMHVYTGANQWAESYLSFEFAGAGHLAFLDTTATHRWGYLPQRTSRFGMGASQFYDGDVFGSDATRLARSPWEAADRTRQMLRGAFSHARRLGIRTGIGFEPYQIPDEILRALPPEAKPAHGARGARFDIESVTARDLLEARLAQLLEAYPDVDYVWLWEDEGMNWESRRTGVPLSVTPFLEAHDFLRRNAPGKRLVLSGWGGVARNFEHFHQKLPGDVIFSCLSDSLGWDPVHEVFGKLEGRERWPVLWIEDDPAMWLPQFHVSRFQADIERAAGFGCQGLLGIHWRHRMVDATAGFQARFSWDAGLTSEQYYRHYARCQAAGTRGEQLAAVLEEADRNRKLLSTFTAEVKDGHVVTHEFSGDYNEAFTFWNNYEPEPAVVESQKQVAAALRAIAGGAQSPGERERLEYLTRQVAMLVPYADAWRLAHRLHGVLQAALELKTKGDAQAAAGKVRTEGVPLWLELAPRVRAVMLDFQRVVATRNDLGQLASMHDKFVRLALIRLRLSMKEFLGELPEETESLLKTVTQPDTGARRRLIVPTRPTLLAKGETVRLTIVAPAGADSREVTLHTRQRGGEWFTAPAKLLGRQTWQATLGPFSPEAGLVEYFISAGKLAAPEEAPRQVYMATLV